MNDVVIGKGKIFGKGVFAKRDFKKGEIVIKYNLVPLTKKEYDSLSEMEKNFCHTYSRQIYIYSSPERYVNHSSKPNTIQDIKNQCDIAIRDIICGEEITTDATKDDAL